jgi:hypothetical protein
MWNAPRFMSDETLHASSGGPWRVFYRQLLCAAMGPLWNWPLWNGGAMTGHEEEKPRVAQTTPADACVGDAPGAVCDIVMATLAMGGCCVFRDPVSHEVECGVLIERKSRVRSGSSHNMDG